MSAKPIAAAIQVEDVRRYYDDNTTRFEKFGQAGTSIHRAVHGPGAATLSCAVHYVDELILKQIGPGEGPPRILDLGCGLGATLLYIASRRDVVGEGITLSPVQAISASKRIEALGLQHRVRCREGSFQALPLDLHDFDAAFSIEAFVHSPDAKTYFAEASRVLRAGGKLILCDDFLDSPTETVSSRREQRWLDEFTRGWHIGSLVRVDDARRLGQEVGLFLTSDVDLTPYLDLQRPARPSHPISGGRRTPPADSQQLLEDAARWRGPSTGHQVGSDSLPIPGLRAGLDPDGIGSAGSSEAIAGAQSNVAAGAQRLKVSSTAPAQTNCSF